MEIKFLIEDLINRNLTTFKIDNDYLNLSEFINKNPENKTVKIKRKIVKRITNNLVLLDSPFPYDTSAYEEFLVPIKPKKQETKNHSFHLLVLDDYIYCNKCDFLSFFSVGDSLFIVKI